MTPALQQPPPHLPTSTSEEGGNGGAKKRQRVLYSCTECHRRKQKCNRETPCQHCILRKAPHLCIQYRPGYDSLDTDSRISRLEMALDRGIEQVLDRLSALEGNRGSPPIEGSRRDAGVGSSRKRKTSDDYSTAPTPSTAPNLHVAPTEPKGFDPLAMTLPYDSASATYASLRAHLYPGATGDDSNESRLTAPASRLLQELPDPNRCRDLLDHFFDKVNLYMPLPDTLQPILQALTQSGPMLKADDLHHFSILASILSLSLITAPIELILDEPASRFTEARSLLDAAHLALLTADTLQAADLDKVTAWVLLSRVLHIDERTSDAWAAATRAVTTAYIINLHQEPKMAITSPSEEEERRRIWTMTYFQEKSLSIILNRPSTILDSLCTTPSPETASRVDPSTPGSQFHYLYTLAKLMGRVNVIVQSTDGNSQIEEVLRVDADICTFRDTLPPFFRGFVDANKFNDEDIPVYFGSSAKEMILSHLWTVASEVDHLRIALHRPFLSPSSIGSQQSRAVSIEASSQSLARRSILVKAFRKQYGDARAPRWYTVMLSHPQRFNLVLACCVSLLLNPRDGDALKLRTLIEDYMALLPRRTWRSLQDADYRRAKSFERELKVLQLFLDRANRLSDLYPSGPVPATAPSIPASTTTSRKKTLVEQASDALDSTFWQYQPRAENRQQQQQQQSQPQQQHQHRQLPHQPPFQYPLPIPQQSNPSEANNFFDFLSQGNTDETELQNSLLEALGTIPWSYG